MFDRSQTDRDRFAAAVLAGGRSRRMGTDKALLPWQGGSTLLERALHAALDVTPLVAIAGGAYTSQALRVSMARGTGHPATILRDPVDDSGPLAGVLAACEWAYRLGVRVVVTLPVDCPRVPGKALRALALHAHDLELQAPVHADGSYLLAAWPVHLGEYIHTAVLAGTRAVHELHTSLHSQAIPPADLGLTERDLVNVNRMEEYERERE